MWLIIIIIIVHYRFNLRCLNKAHFCKFKEVPCPSTTFRVYLFFFNSISFYNSKKCLFWFLLHGLINIICSLFFISIFLDQLDCGRHQEIWLDTICSDTVGLSSKNRRQEMFKRTRKLYLFTNYNPISNRNKDVQERSHWKNLCCTIYIPGHLYILGTVRVVVIILISKNNKKSPE